MNYNVVSLGQQSPYDLNGVRFRGKSFLFWKTKTNHPVMEVVVIFDKKYENMKVRDGVVILSLKGLDNYADIREALRIFKEIMGNNNLQFHFIVGNDNERQVAEALGREFNLAYVVQDVERDNFLKKEQKAQKIEEEMKESLKTNLETEGNQIIRKEDNGHLKEITIHNGVAYENNGYLNSEEEKMSLLRQWMQDPVKVRELENLSAEARNDLLTEAVMSNRKAHYMESAREQVASNQMEKVAIDKAIQEDGLVNDELGIVQNNVYNSNQYSAVEQHGESVKVVNPEVARFGISSDGISSFSSNINNENQDFQMQYEQEQEREANKTFYVDDDYNLYDENENLLGKLGVNGYMPDYENNSLLKDGKHIGYLSDYKDLGRGNVNNKDKPKVRTLEKPKYDLDNDRAAFISFPVIIFILSAILLIASFVLLFVID